METGRFILNARRLLLLTGVLLVLVAPARANGSATLRTQPGDLLWEDRLDVSTREQAFAAAASGDRLFVAGFTSRTAPPFDRDFLVRAHDTRTGALLWQDRVDKGGDDFALAVTTDGKSVWVSGNTEPRGVPNRNWLVRAYDAETGQLRWEDVFDLSGSVDAVQGNALALDRGLLYVGGSGTSAALRVESPTALAGVRGPTVPQAWSQARTRSASGALVEAASVAQPDGDARGDLGCRIGSDAGPNPFPAGSLAGAVLVVDRGICAVSQKALNAAASGAVGMILVMLPGQQPIQFGSFDTVGIPVLSISHAEMAALRSAGTEVVVTMTIMVEGIVRAYNASSGANVWQDRFDRGGPSAQQARSFALKAGRLFVAGVSQSPTAPEAAVRAYDAQTGALQWEHYTPGFEGPGTFTFARRPAVQGDRVFVGSAIETVAGADFLVQAFSAANGGLLWEDRINKGGLDLLTDIDADGGGVVALGTGGPRCLFEPSPPSDCDTYVRSYAGETGELRWEREFVLSPLDDQSLNVRAHAGQVFVSHIAEAFANGDGGKWRIHALDSSSGESLWESAGGDVELPLALTVHRRRLFVPGRSVDPATGNWDFIVRAYDAGGSNDAGDD